MPKPFSPSLFLEHDKIAKIKALEYYKSKGILLKTNEDCDVEVDLDAGTK